MAMKEIKQCVGVLLTLVVFGCADAEKPASTADVDTAPPPAESEPVQEHAGKKIYSQYCFSCHGPGLSGAPRLGDVDAWAPRIAKGKDLLLKTTIEGIPPAMPARGICSSCTDEELAQVIDYMIEESR